MEPLKPEVKRNILDSRPTASPEDIHEYERLLAQRFTADPSQPGTPTAFLSAPAAPGNPANVREARLQELHQKLFD